MVFFILLSTILLCPFGSVLHLLAPFFQTPHLVCVNLLHNQEASEITSAFLCGNKIHSSELVDFFSRSSMFHLIVAAKAHLTAISFLFVWLCEKFKSFYFSVFGAALLLIYLLVCGPQAPLLRAFVYMGLLFLSRQLRLGWTRVYTLMLATLLCLTLEPNWYSSLALLHSASCALAFMLAQAFGFRSASAFVFSYFFTAPFLWGWANLHPLGIVFNVLLAPVLFIFWFCSSVGTLLLPRAAPVFAKWIFSSMSFCRLFLDPIPSAQKTEHLQPRWLWLLFWLTALGLWLGRRIRRSKKLR